MFFIVCVEFIDKEFEKSNYDIEPVGGAVVVWLQGNCGKLNLSSIENYNCLFFLQKSLDKYNSCGKLFTFQRIYNNFINFLILSSSNIIKPLQLGSKRVWRCRNAPRTERSHLATRHSSVQQVSGRRTTLKRNLMRWQFFLLHRLAPMAILKWH